MLDTDIKRLLGSAIMTRAEYAFLRSNESKHIHWRIRARLINEYRRYHRRVM